MLTRAIDALDAIGAALTLPSGYILRGDDHHASHKAKFVAGEFQLNEDFSLYIQKADLSLQKDNDFNVEIRLFTRKVYAVVFFSYWAGGKPFGKELDIKNGKPFFHAETYRELVKDVVDHLQVAMDGAPSAVI